MVIDWLVVVVGMGITVEMMRLIVVDELGEYLCVRQDYLVIYMQSFERSLFGSCLHLGIYGAKHHTSRIVKNKLRYGCGTGHAAVPARQSGQSLNVAVEMRSTKSNLMIKTDSLTSLGNLNISKLHKVPKTSIPNHWGCSRTGRSYGMLQDGTAVLSELFSE